MIEQAPGCHGLPSAVSSASPTCRECAHARSCIRDAGTLLASFPLTPDVQRERKLIVVTARALLGPPPAPAKGEGAPAPVASPTRAPLTAREQSLVQALPKRVASQVKSLIETGWFTFAKAELHAGRNPADKGWKQVYCAQLLSGTATRETLRMALITELDLTAASAKVQLCNALSIFAAGGIAVESGGRLVLSAKSPD